MRCVLQVVYCAVVGFKFGNGFVECGGINILVAAALGKGIHWGLGDFRVDDKMVGKANVCPAKLLGFGEHFFFGVLTVEPQSVGM